MNDAEFARLQAFFGLQGGSTSSPLPFDTTFPTTCPEAQEANYADKSTIEVGETKKGVPRSSKGLNRVQKSDVGDPRWYKRNKNKWMERKMDWMERAMREEEAPLILEKAAEEQRIREELFLQEQERKREAARQKHANDIEEKTRLKRMLHYKVQNRLTVMIINIQKFIGDFRSKTG